MNFDISFADNLNVPFSDLIDKNLWEVYEVKGIENGWLVRRKTNANNVPPFTITTPIYPERNTTSND